MRARGRAEPYLYTCDSVEQRARKYLADDIEVASWNYYPEPNWRH
jgi:hypothetical protein